MWISSDLEVNQSINIEFCQKEILNPKKVFSLHLQLKPSAVSNIEQEKLSESIFFDDPRTEELVVEEKGAKTNRIEKLNPTPDCPQLVPSKNR